MDELRDLKAKQEKKQYSEKQLEKIRRGALKVIRRREKEEQEKRRADLEHFYETNSYT